MKHYFTPHNFHHISKKYSAFKWRLLLWSALLFVFYLILEAEIVDSTPHSLIWLTLALLFLSIQCLVFASFVFFFQVLPSQQISNKSWLRFYQIIEWCETLLFAFLLPMPTLSFIYALLSK